MTTKVLTTEGSFGSQQSRIRHLMSESRRMSLRRSLTLSAGGLEALLLASEVAEQVMANLKSMVPPTSDLLIAAAETGCGAESGTDGEKNENETSVKVAPKNESDERAAVPAQPARAAQAQGRGRGQGQQTKRHTRSLSDSGVVVVLQMADANQRARDRRRAQLEKKKALEEKNVQKSEEELREAEKRRELERMERERKENEALAAKNERLLKLFVRSEESCIPSRPPPSPSTVSLPSTPISPRAREAAAAPVHGGQDRTARPLQESEDGTSDKDARRSGSDVESAEEQADLGMEEWERQEADNEANEAVWGSAEEKEKQRGKLKLRLTKIKPTKIISGRKKNKEKRERSSSKREEKQTPDPSKPRFSPLLHSSPV